MIDQLPPLETMLVIAFVIFFAIGLHEYSHAKFAEMAGDPTPGIYGRVTLNLTKHFTPIGTLMIAITSVTGYGIGWGKPCPMDPRKMKNPRWDFFIAVLAGPTSNLIQAIIYGSLLRVCIAQDVPADSYLVQLGSYGLLINLSLCCFNLIPLGPLDGHWLIGTFMPEKMRLQWYRFNNSVGSFLLIGLILLGQFTNHSIVDSIMGPLLRLMAKLIIGHSI